MPSKLFVELLVYIQTLIKIELLPQNTLKTSYGLKLTREMRGLPVQILSDVVKASYYKLT